MNSAVLDELEMSNELLEELADIVGGASLDDGGNGNPWADWSQKAR